MKKFTRYTATFLLVLLVFSLLSGCFNQQKETVTVAFSLDGGTLHGMDSFSVEADKGETISAPAEPVKPGFTFAGWFKDSAHTSEWIFSHEPVNQNTVLYAKWVPTGEATYIVTFDTMGGSAVAALQFIVSGSAITAPANPTRSGHTFDGWYKDNTLTTPWDFAKDAVTADITLYAKWLEGTLSTYTVRFEPNGGSALLSITGVREGSMITKPQNPTKSGYTFAGWYQDSGLKNPWDFSKDTVTQNITLYAKWTKSSSGSGKVTVSFELGGGFDYSVSSKTVAKNTSIALPHPKIPSHLLFNGWFTSAQGGYYLGRGGDSYKVTKSITLYAQWTRLDDHGSDGDSGGTTNTYPSVVKIAYIGPMTGNYSLYGIEMRYAIQMLIDEINSAGGIRSMNGAKLECDFFDDQNDSEKSVQQANAVIASGAYAACLGPFSTGNGLAVKALFNNAKIPLISTSISNEIFAQDTDYCFSAATTQAQQMAQYADFVYGQLGYRKAAVLWANSEWGKSVRDNFTSFYPAKGGSIVLDKSYDIGDTVFDTLLDQLAASGADFLFLAGHIAECRHIVNQMRARGITLPIVSTNALMLPEYLEFVGANAEGQIMMSYFSPSNDNPAAFEAFRTKYLGRFPDIAFVDNHIFNTADTMYLLRDVLESIGRKGSVTSTAQLRESIAKTIPTLTYSGLMGSYNSNSDGQISKTLVPLVVKNGKFVKFTAPSDTYKVAFIGPVSGDFEQYGRQIQRGIMMKIAEVNRLGGIDGKKIVLKTYDDQNDVDISVQLAKQLVSDSSILAVLGPFSSTNAMAMAPYFQTAGIPLIAVTASHPDVTTGKSFVFRGVSTVAHDISVAARHAKNTLPVNSAYLLTVDNDWGDEVSASFQSAFIGAGGTISGKKTYIEGSTRPADFKSYIQAVATSTDLLVVISMVNDASEIVEEYAALPASQKPEKMLLMDVVAYDEFLNNLSNPTIANDIYGYTRFTYYKDQRPRFTSFKAAYDALYQDIGLDIFVANAYDSTNVLLNALNAVGPDRTAIRDWMADTTRVHEGVTGDYKFDSTRSPQKHVYFMQVQGGQWEIIG